MNMNVSIIDQRIAGILENHPDIWHDFCICINQVQK